MARLPLDGNPRVSSVHGQPTNMGRYGKHLGMDWAVNRVPFYAPESGVVKSVVRTASLGLNAEVLIKNTLWRFAHLESFDLKAGQLFGMGQKLGVTGNSGETTGPHLHADARVNGTAWTDGFDKFLNPSALVDEWNRPTPAPSTGKNWIPAGAVGKMDVILSRSVTSWRIYKPGTKVEVARLNPAKNGGRYLVEAIDSLPNRVIIKSPTYGRVSLPVDADATFARAA